MSTGDRGPEAAVAAVLGGAVTRERLVASARAEGRDGSGLVRSLLAQSLPALADLVRAYGEVGGTLRLDRSFLQASPRALRLLDPALMRRERCLPIEVLGDLCILAVESGRACRAVEAVRRALNREVLPVLADAGALDEALCSLAPAPPAARQGPLPRRDSPVHARFRDLVLDNATLEALRVEETGT